MCLKVGKIEVYIGEVCEHLSSSQIEDIQGLEGREPLQNTHFNLELRALAPESAFAGNCSERFDAARKTARFLAGPLAIHQNGDHK